MCVFTAPVSLLLASAALNDSKLESCSVDLSKQVINSRHRELRFLERKQNTQRPALEHFRSRERRVLVYINASLWRCVEAVESKQKHKADSAARLTIRSSRERRPRASPVFFSHTRAHFSRGSTTLELPDAVFSTWRINSDIFGVCL